MSALEFSNLDPEEIRKRDFLAVLGPTASGKTALAAKLAQNLNGEIISCDSVAVYKGFDIGTAKDRNQVLGHHLVDVVSWDEDFDAHRYRLLALEAIKEIKSRGKLPVVCGGTGLYFRALIGDHFHQNVENKDLRRQLTQEDQGTLYARLQEIDAKRAREIHHHDKYRIVRALEIIETKQCKVSDEWRKPQPTLNPYVIIVDRDRQELHKSIAVRTAGMLERGLVDEVRGLLETGVTPHAKPMRSIGYAQVARFLEGALPERELADRIVFATRQYAKRQCTWFRNSRVTCDYRISGMMS
jgi:tRNA dimethylallyltransferase